MSRQWLTLHDVAERFKVTRVTIWAWRRAGKFPPPITLPGGRVLRWDSLEIEAFERGLLKARAA